MRFYKTKEDSIFARKLIEDVVGWELWSNRIVTSNDIEEEIINHIHLFKMPKTINRESIQRVFYEIVSEATIEKVTTKRGKELQEIKSLNLKGEF